jgi:hypothetical protein
MKFMRKEDAREEKVRPIAKKVESQFEVMIESFEDYRDDFHSHQP